MFIRRLIKKYFVQNCYCAYCSKKTAWRYKWEARIIFVQGRLELWPEWRRLINGACSCKVPV